MIPRISYGRWRSGRSGPVRHPSQDLKRDERVLGRMESVRVERLESVKEPITIRSGPHPEHTEQESKDAYAPGEQVPESAR